MDRPDIPTPFGCTQKQARRSQAAFLKVAGKLRAGVPEDAFGRCLGLSLEMAQVVAKRGLAVDLVAWSVIGDPNFLDHWAVAVSDRQVIDLTRVQVDGRTGLLYDIDDYPPNFLRRRRYPAAVLMPALAVQRIGAEGQFNAAFVWRVRWLMFGHDVRQAWAAWRPARAGMSLLSLAKFALLHTTRRFQGSLQARREALLGRIDGSPSERPSIRSRQ